MKTIKDELLKPGEYVMYPTDIHFRFAVVAYDSKSLIRLPSLGKWIPDEYIHFWRIKASELPDDIREAAIKSQL